jgi:endonuclease/exonuclease/phosphatase family metal-dependent hydrolase
MRLLLYNIRYGAGAGTAFHVPVPFAGYLRNTTANLERITDFIRGKQPDVVALVEVDSGSFRSNRRNQAERIAQALGHYMVFENKYGECSWIGRLPIFRKQANAFLTKNEVYSPRFHYFNQGIKRLVIELEFEDLTIFLVHLSLKFRHRHRQLTDLYELLKPLSKPVIVAGDFNPLWGDHEMELFMAATGLINANRQHIPSYPSWMPRRQLDFILHSEHIRVTHLEVPNVVYSDHLPLICDLEVGSGS